MEMPSVSMSAVSSRMLPSLFESMYRISSCRSCSLALFSAPWMTSWLFFSARSGRSVSPVVTSSWSSRPLGVMVKLSSATLTLTSGA